MSLEKPLTENDSFVNESFLRDQIAGMKKIDKLVEEAEQSISKVVKGFDKFFKDPNIKSCASVDSIDIIRKDLKFDIDDSCDCPQKLRCDCESKGLDQESFLGIPFSPAPSELLTTEPISDTDHLNTISEQSESIVASPPNSGCNIKSVLSDIVSQNEVSLRGKDIKNNAKISIDTRNIVQISPITNHIEEAPLLQEAGTETDDMKNRLKTNVLEIQNMPGIEIRSAFVVQKIYNINIQPSSNLIDPVNVPNKKNAFFIELKHDDPVIVQMVGSQRAPYFDNKDNEPMDTSVIKAPVYTVPTRESITQTPNRKIDKNCKYCMHKVDSTPENKEGIVDELFDDIRDLQIPMVSTRSLDAKSNTSSVSEYVVVQDDATQVSVSNISRDDRVQSSTSKSSNIQTSGSAPKEPEQIETFVSTGTASSTNMCPANMRPPIPGHPMDTYQPIPYDKEEIAEIELFNKPLEGSDVTPFDLSKGADSRLIDVEKAQCTPKSRDSSRCGNRKSMEKMKPTDKDDTITLQPVENKNVDDNHFMLAPVCSCDLMNGCPNRTLVRVEKPDNFSDLNDFICLANAYDFNAACEDSISSAGINITCSRQTAPADQMAMNKNANEQKLIDLIGFKVNCRQRLDESDQNDKSCMRCDSPRIHANDEEQKRIDLFGSKVNGRQQPNEFDDIDKSNIRSSFRGSTDETFETEKSKKRDSNASSISRSKRPISSAIRDTIQEISTVDLSAIATSNLTPTGDIEGVQIMETTYESSQLQNLYHAPYPDRAPSAGPTKPNPTAMSAMVQYDQKGVNESLGQNLLLAQLRDDATLVSYHKRPSVYIDSSSSEISSHSSGDYPERNKYLMRAKRRQLSYQRGIVTDDPDDFILSRSPERSDPLSDGELSHYTTSTGEMLPIGPRLLKNKNFMRRRPDRIFQMELNQRNMHIHRQHNYFNNWVSYYVTDNANL